MKRKQLWPWVVVTAIAVLASGCMVCVAGTMVASELRGARSPFPRLGPRPTSSQATSTPTPLSPAGRPVSGVTPTPSATAASPTPFPTDTPPPGPTSSPTATPRPAQTPTSTPTARPAVPTSTPELTAANPTSTPRPTTASPTDTPEPPTPNPSSTIRPSPTTVIVTPRGPTEVTGRLIKDGAPVEAGVAVKLEDSDYAIVATATTDAQGVYTFEGLAAKNPARNVLFAQAWNEQYEIGEVASWAWMGLLTISRGATLELPDFEIGLLGFEQSNPASGASLSASEISAQNPLVFDWAPYPQASAYWVDLTRGDDLTRVWQSGLVSTASVTFGGTLADGSRIAADTYWWGIGARTDVGDYQLTVYGYLPSLVITP